MAQTEPWPRSIVTWRVLACAAAVGCVSGTGGVKPATAPPAAAGGGAGAASAAATQGPALVVIGAPAPTPPPVAWRPLETLPASPVAPSIDGLIDLYFARAATSRAYVQLDKPLYQPGETVWFRAALLQTASLAPAPDMGLTARLLDARGAPVGELRLRSGGGVAANAFDLPADAPGGEYTLEIEALDGTRDRRSVIVSTYEAPRLKKRLEFLRKAYGPGDTATAALEVARATGEPFASQPLVAVATLDGAEIARVSITTDAEGKAVVPVPLPASIAGGDGLLTVLASDGGMTESVQKRIPIVLRTVELALYPEGGELVEGLPGRVYLAATNPLGKPADVEGRVVDDAGRAVASFRSVRDGLGRFELVPEAGRRYQVEITKPEGVARRFDVPAARATGCALLAVDDFGSQRPTLDVVAACTEARSLHVTAVQRERRVASGDVAVTARAPVRLALPVGAELQGAVRVTLFDGRTPLAERLIYRGRGQDLRVTIAPERPRYGPRDPVTLRVRTTDAAGRPVPASVGLSVVDDTVLAFADDRTASIGTHLLLEAELPAVPIEDPNFYFSAKPEAAAALDLVMGTSGWRRFDWQPVWTPPPPRLQVLDFEDDVLEGEILRPDEEFLDAVGADEDGAPMAAPAPRAADRPAAGGRAAARRGRAAVPPVADEEAPAGRRPPVGAAADKPRLPGRPAPVRARAEQGRLAAGVRGEAAKVDARALAAPEPHGYAPVRVFPAPRYAPGHDGPRTDFRETIFWAPDVRTGADGAAAVTFHLSDAVTSFRAVAEGAAAAGGAVGRGEAIVQSKMPLALDARLPLEVSSGDEIELPITLANETDRPLTAELTAAFGAAFRPGRGAPARQSVRLAAGEKRAFFYPLTVVGRGGEGDVAIAVATSGLKDEIRKQIRVVPLGFPLQVSLAGTVKGTRRHEVDLGAALPGTIVASVRLYPSPLASMTSGSEALLQEPSGCFEQTSSTNYPNVMVMQYLAAHDAAAPAVVDRAAGLLDRGYKRLVGYETKEKGYEWFGEHPGHEALTAYGLMEFADMAEVYDVDRAMVDRTAEWLLARRDGAGGYARNDRALDSFGAASPATTDAYITWALTEARRARGLEREIGRSRALGLESKDPYLVALAALTLVNVEPRGADTARVLKRLAAMQAPDGSFPGARESITMSGGESLTIETTSLAVVAFVKAARAGAAGGDELQLRKGAEWLNGKRDGAGSFGSTQGTVLALKALTAYADHSRATASGGVASVVVNGKTVGKIKFAKGRKETLEFDDLGPALVAGKNVIEVWLETDRDAGEMPYSVAVAYRAQAPRASAEAQVTVATRLAKREVKLGESVRLRAEIASRSPGGLPMTLARIGIPGGLTYQTWQLKELKDRKLVDFYETREREVILYFRALPPSARKSIDLDLLATVPGAYVAPASQAYLYYTDEHRSWAPPVEVKVAR